MNQRPSPAFCHECGSALPEDARFCPRCGTKVARPPEDGSGGVEEGGVGEGGPATAIPTPEISPELRVRYERAREALMGDRREVAVLFADVQGYTSLAESMDPEEIGIVMQRLLREMAGAVHRWGGYVDKYIGDAVMALFGAPTAHEDDAERAVEAALAMQAEVERRRGDGPGLVLRVGVNVGEVVAGHVGAESSSQYTVMGDTVNVASRLENAAEPGTVLVSDAVWRRVSHRFEAEEIPPLELKGKTGSVRAFRVTGRKAMAGTSESTTPFVGRERELSEVAGWLDAVPDGSVPPLVLEGEAGRGKSRLVTEALGRAEGIRAIGIGFSEIHPPGAPSPPGDLFRQVAGDGPGAIEHALGSLGEEAEVHRAGILDLAHQVDPAAGAPQEHVEPEEARRNRWLALAALLRAAARERPLVVLAEDLHRAEEGEGDLVGFLADALGDAPAGLLLTGRPPIERLPEGARVLALEPLGDEAARRIVDARGSEVPAEARRELARRGQGNPLFLEELAIAAREGAEIPSTLQGILRSRIDRLEPGEQRLLQMASVLGLRFPEALLARMHALDSGAPPFDGTVEALEEAGYLDPAGDGERRFRHPLVQEIAHRGILHGVRRVLHESAARMGVEVFEQPDAEAAFFAHHWWEADRPEEAAPWLWTAGREAWEAFDLAAAERWLGRGVEAVGREPDALDAGARARLYETAGTVAFHRGRLDDASERAEALEALGEAADEPAWIARALEIRGRVEWNRGRLDEARDTFRAGLDRLPDATGRVAADLHNDLGVVHYYRGAATDARRHYERALAIREAEDDAPGMAKVLSNLGNLWIDLEDDLDRAAGIYERALDLAEAAGDRRLQCSATLNLGRSRLERGDCETAIRWFEDGQARAERIGWPYARLLSMLNRAQALVALGRIGEAIPLYEEIRREGERAFEAVNRFNALAYPFEMWIRVAEDERAADDLAAARSIAGEERLEEVADELATMEGRLAIARGDHRPAVEAFDRAVEAAGRLGHESVERVARAHRARAAARAGLPSPGGDEAPRYEGARRPLAALLDYLAADTRAIRSPDREAAAALRDAGEAAAGLGDPGLERAAFERAGEVLESIGDPRAGDAFERAAAAMRALADGLPRDLRERFLAHPRNARVGGLSTSGG